jgi:hypothetical protein
MTECVNYFNSMTQNDIPVRQLDIYTFDTTDNNDPCNTWVCNSSAKEYECMGIEYNLGLDKNGNTGYISSYKNLTDWAKVWEDGSCLNLFQSMVTGYGTNQSTVAFSSSNFIKVQEDFNFMFSRYFNADSSTQYFGHTGTNPNTDPCDPDNKLPTYGCTPLLESLGEWCQEEGKFSNADNNCNVWIGGVNTLTIPGKQGYNPFLDVLLDACYNIPGVCSQTQDYMCSTCDREQIYSNQTLIKFCGCSTGADTGDTFYNSDLQNFNSTCDPLCNRLDTIKYADPITGSTLQCNANVCVIDAVQINSISSSGISPTFNQVCPACADGQGNCICIIDASFTTTISSIQGENGEGPLNTQPKFNQYCPNSQCYLVDPATNQYMPVACSNQLPKGNQPDVEIPWKFAIICLVILMIAILVIFAYKYQSDNIPIYTLPQKYYK